MILKIRNENGFQIAFDNNIIVTVDLANKNVIDEIEIESKTVDICIYDNEKNKEITSEYYFVNENGYANMNTDSLAIILYHMKYYKREKEKLK